MKREKRGEKGGVLLRRCFLQQSARSNSFTAANYRNAMQSVQRFLAEKAETFTVGEVTRQWVLEYILYMKGTDNLAAGSANFYLRILRAVYNRAVQDGLAGGQALYPFDGVNIPVPPTLKRTLSMEEIKMLMNMDLSGNARLAFVRDLFLFLFYARGMCFVDVFSLKYSDVSGGYIRYVRSKTGVPLNVKIEPRMQVLMDRYREEGSPYLFPSLHRNCYKAEQEVSETTACRRVNRQLNVLGKMLHLSQPLTVYVARHSWASLAEASGMSSIYISQGLGHSSERVTRIYMKGIPSTKMDEANRDMLKTMFKGEKTDEFFTKIQEEKERCLILCKNETSDSSDSVTNLYLLANVRLIGI